MSSTEALAKLGSMLVSGDVEVVDLAVPLGPDTPLIQLPDMFEQTPPIKAHEISHYDDKGPFWAWSWYELGEHSGTHFDAPVHWVTGKDHANATTDTIPPKNFVAPVNVIDCSKETAENPDFLLTAERVKEWEAEHGEIEEGSWVVMRTDWWPRNRSREEFLNVDENGPHSPGPDVPCVEYLISKGIVGWGTECVGTDAGAAGGFEPPYPAHNLLHKNNRYGLASLAHLDKLPPKGAVLIVAPLKFVGGTGSPIRALALVPKS